MSPEEEILQNLGRQIKGQIPEGFGFILLIAQLGEKGTLLYTASVDRMDALQAMREFIAVQSEERNWQREMPDLEIEEEFERWWLSQLKRAPSYSANRKIREMCRDAFLGGRSSA